MGNNEITINGVSLASMGTTLLSGAYSALLTPPALKDFVENNDPLKDGTEVIVPGTDGEDDTSTPKLKERDVTLTFLIQGESETEFFDNYNAFVAMLHKGMINLHIPELERNFSLIYSNSTQFANYMLNACKLAVKFREPNPSSSSDGLLWPPSGEQWNNDLDELIKDFLQHKEDNKNEIQKINEELDALDSIIGNAQVSGQRIVPYIRKVTAEQFVTGNYPFDTPEGWTPTPYTLPMLEPVAVSDTITSMKSVSIYEIGNLEGTDSEGNPVAADLVGPDTPDGGSFPLFIPTTSYNIDGTAVPALAEGQTVIVRIHKTKGARIHWANDSGTDTKSNIYQHGGLGKVQQRKVQTVSFAVTRKDGQNVVTQIFEPDFYHKNFGDSPLAQYASMRDAFDAILSGIEDAKTQATEAKTQAYDAYSMGEGALDIAQDANNTANIAYNTANEALAQAPQVHVLKSYFGMYASTGWYFISQIGVLSGSSTKTLVIEIPDDIYQKYNFSNIGSTTSVYVNISVTVTLQYKAIALDSPVFAFMTIPVATKGLAYPFADSIQVSFPTSKTNPYFYELVVSPSIQDLGGKHYLVLGMTTSPYETGSVTVIAQEAFIFG